MRRFLRKLWPPSTRFADRSSEPRIVAASESVGRFIFQKRDIANAVPGRAKPNAFKPQMNAETQLLETSVCRMSLVSADRIDHLGRTIRAPHAALAISAVGVGRLPRQLSCLEAPEPDFEEHAVIAGWPDGEDNKSVRMSLLQEIAAAAEPVRYLAQPAQ